MNKYTNTRIEFHIIHSFPVSCLNRDDVGAPKSAIIGGVERARVSSQCWKRAVRLMLHDLGVKTANRTKLVTQCIADECLALGATPEQAAACGNAAAKPMTKSVKDGVSDTLLFLSDSETKALAQAFCDNNFAPELKDLTKLCKKALNPAHDGLDIALFGRMVANTPEMNVEAAASFAHAISTHKVASEVDFFTAVDDCKDEMEDESGAGHMGSLEFNSATYYRYISLDLGQLAETLKTEEIQCAVNAFVKALFLAVPAARQATMTAACPWNYGLITLRHGQNLQISFNDPVKVSPKTDLVTSSREELKKRFEAVRKMYGSLFGEKAVLEVAPDADNFDEALAKLNSAIAEL
ncbi:MAG: type I-E CRISPR-associated protein Cas7/Cse4/CasC [Victivallaceae bacterium]